MISKTEASTVQYLLSRRALRSLERENDKKELKHTQVNQLNQRNSRYDGTIFCTAVYFNLTFSAKSLLQLFNEAWIMKSVDIDIEMIFMIIFQILFLCNHTTLWFFNI